METVTLPEQYSEQIKTISGYPIRVTSYRLWDTLYAKTEVALDGMGGWFAEGRREHAGWSRSKCDCGSRMATCETAIA
jgi:hypothetical protein